MMVSKAKIAFAKRQLIGTLKKQGFKLAHFSSLELNKLASILAKEATWKQLRTPVIFNKEQGNV